MADNFERYENEGSTGFMMGLLTGTVLGAGLGMLLAPKAGAEIRGQIGEQARNLGNMASEQYRKASNTASDWADRGRGFIGRAREAVQRGAEETRGYSSDPPNPSYGGGTGTTGSSYSGGSYGSGASTQGGEFGRSPGSSDFGRS
jgi:gas vesicle protein